jgi:predicted phosphoribosyltransferase
VAYEVAKALDAPLDVFIVRKLGVPGHEELAMGAIASGGTRVLNQDVVGPLHISPQTIDRVTAHEKVELERRERLYRGGRPSPIVKDRVVILIDDGLATGATMRAAVGALRRQQPRQLIVAVPIAAPEICVELRGQADSVVCAVTPRPFFGVGRWYVDFSQTTDDEVRDLLTRSRHPETGVGRSAAS